MQQLQGTRMHRVGKVEDNQKTNVLSISKHYSYESVFILILDQKMECCDNVSLHFPSLPTKYSGDFNTGKTVNDDISQGNKYIYT